MTLTIHIDDRTLTGDQVIHKLISYGLVSQLAQEIVIDYAIADVPFTPAELASAHKQIAEQYDLTDPQKLDTWLKSLNYDRQNFELDITRFARLQRYKEDKWGNEVPNLFLQRKQELDKAIYSIIRTKDISVSQELYFRLQAGEQTFTELATKYSLGPEASTGGLVGPVELGKLHPQVRGMLSKGKAGQLFPPQVVEQWVIIVRLEQFMPAQLDQNTKDRLINDAFLAWLQAKIQQSKLSFS